MTINTIKIKYLLLTLFIMSNLYTINAQDLGDWEDAIGFEDDVDDVPDSHIPNELIGCLFISGLALFAYCERKKHM